MHRAQNAAMLVAPTAAVRALWQDLSLPDEALDRLQLDGSEPALPSSFAVGTAVQASLAAAALAATEIGRARNGVVQGVAVDMREAAFEASGAFRLDGRDVELWDPLAGLYRCGLGDAGGWVRLHTNFAHHRDGLLQRLGLPPGPGTTREQVAAALAGWQPEAFEQAAADAGLVAAALRTFEQWQAHPQQAAVASLPLVEIARIGDAPALRWPDLPAAVRPLEGLLMLDLTRILAGPVAGRTLAAYGADVMLVNSPHLPNIGAIADTSRGKRSAHADLHDAGDRAAFAAALSQSHVMLQGYRPGSLERLGFGPMAAAQLRPGIVYTSLSAYGRLGPWADRRGFDSLLQTATGFNADEAAAAGAAAPKPMPIQVLDMATGFLMAFGSVVGLLQQQAFGGSWHVQVSLARTAVWLRSLGRVTNGFAAAPVDCSGLWETTRSGFGELVALRHAARLSHTPARYARPSMPPGSQPLAWDRDASSGARRGG